MGVRWVSEGDAAVASESVGTRVRARFDMLGLCCTPGQGDVRREDKGLVMGQFQVRSKVGSGYTVALFVSWALGQA